MFDINRDAPAGAQGETLAKAHPAQALIGQPGWRCPKCEHKNPVNAAFCEKCEPHT